MKNKNTERRSITIALAGNPNVGKSTLFNSLTGMRQHTGNWSGKTVDCAHGNLTFCDTQVEIVDLPGCYSLISHSGEEEVARDFICFGNPDKTVVVCDAACLQKNLNLVLQCIEISPDVIVCVNMMDEAKRRGIEIDLKLLSSELGVPVYGTCARKKRGIFEMMSRIVTNETLSGKIPQYSEDIEKAILIIQKKTESDCMGRISPRWLAIKMLSGEWDAVEHAETLLGVKIAYDVKETVEKVLKELSMDESTVRDLIASSLLKRAKEIASRVSDVNAKRSATDSRLDRIFCGRILGFVTMLAMIALIFFITLVGANYISTLLGNLLFGIEEKLDLLFRQIGAPEKIISAVVHGMYRVLAWVVSVMLPPMAIFFPLFTLLEDFGYLPRVAFNLDRGFKKCSACGKQALCMCMGFGCNAVGVSGAKIIDSKRERLIAILTNVFVPCNGRFPTIIAMITMFLVPVGVLSYVCGPVIFVAVICLSVSATLFASFLLSKTFLRGTPSSFSLELPPYRLPDFGGVIVRSLFSRTLFVLMRAVVVAAPAGLVIWAFANIQVGNVSLLSACSDFLDPFAKIIGLDGTILFAFILGLPANEIVIPIIIMAYTGGNVLVEFESYSALKDLFVANGWGMSTAVCTMLFSVFHFPCSTTLITMYKETRSIRYTLLGFILPCVFGIAICSVSNLFFSLF